MTDYEWERICRLEGIGFSAGHKAAGCPDVFEPKQWAVIQRPGSGLASDRANTRRSQGELLARITEAVASGALESSMRQREVPIYKTKLDAASPSQNWVTGFMDSSSRGFVSSKVQAGTSIEEYCVITPSAFRDWLLGRGEPPSEHVNACCGSMETLGLGGECEVVRERRTAMKRAAIIKKLERRYGALESAFNRGEPWVTKCRVLDEDGEHKHGWYYLELIERECSARFDGASPETVKDLSAVGLALNRNR